MKKQDEGTTHYYVPVEISDIELKALQKILDYSWEEEQRHYGECEDDVTKDHHVYHELIIVKHMLDRINKKV